MYGKKLIVTTIITTSLTLGCLGFGFFTGKFSNYQKINIKTTTSKTVNQKKDSKRGTVNSDHKDKKSIAKSKLYQKYIVKSGDTLTDLSGRFGVSVGTIVKFNNIANPNLIYTNEILNILNEPKEIKK